MAKFFGANLDKKKVDRTIAAWLAKLSDDFSVFVELEGSDFSVDFLVFKKYGIFDVEAKSWPVREVPADTDWILESRETRPNPYVDQVLDQCDKVRQYILLQVKEIFGEEKAQIVWDEKNNLKVFPVVALSNYSINPSIGIHVYRKTYAREDRLRAHLQRFEWYPNRPKPIDFSTLEVGRLAALFRLQEVDSRTLLPLAPPAAIKKANSPALTQKPVSVPALGPKDVPFAVVSPVNPYQYTYTVTGEQFYGRERELMRTRRALQSSRPVAIIGLQRTGKSSLALESIRRLRDETKSLNLVTFDFRRLRDETPMPQEDLALEFARQLATDIGNEETETVINTYLASSSKGGPAEQRGFFRRVLLKSAELNRRTILFIDECQEIAEFLNENRYKSFFDFVDSLCKESQLELTIVLVSRPSFFELDPIKNINLGRLFEIISLGPLEESAAKAIIDKGSGQLKFTNAARERLLYLTGRHAFWLQFLCHRIFENSVLSNSAEVTDSVVDNVFSTILNDPGCKPQFYLLYQEVDHDADAFDLLKLIAAAACNAGSSVNLAALFPNQYASNR